MVEFRVYRLEDDRSTCSFEMVGSSTTGSDDVFGRRWRSLTDQDVLDQSHRDDREIERWTAHESKNVGFQKSEILYEREEETDDRDGRERVCTVVVVEEEEEKRKEEERCAGGGRWII